MNKWMKMVLIILGILLVLYLYGNSLSKTYILEQERDYYKTTMLYFCGVAKNEAMVIQSQHEILENYNELFVKPVFAEGLINKSCDDFIVGN